MVATISLEHVSKWFTRRGQQIHALDDISFDVAPGEFVSIIGPSGCGKSSLVKAGLLPRLASHVSPIYVEATDTGTEVRLINTLSRRCPQIPEDVSLAELFQGVREGLWLSSGLKILVVLDQFEQWLHAHPDTDDTLLGRALRQCDGRRGT